MSLKNKAVSGLIWTFAQQFSVQIINFGVQVILARILLPEEFGLIAMLHIFIAIGTNLLDGGMTSSLIRTENPDQKDYSTVFFVNLFASVFIFMMAPNVGEFFNQPILNNVLRVYALSFIIRAFVAVQTTRLTKEMNFKLQMKMQIPSVILGGLSGVILALNGYGVWSLVWLNLIQSFLFMVMHWWFSEWKPIMIIDKEKFKYHFEFGYKITLSSLLYTLYRNVYTIIIGKYFSAAQVGFYFQAETLRMYPVQHITTALDKVTYPMFSSIQNDKNSLKIYYKKTMQAVLFLIVPVMTLLLIFANDVFLLVLGEKWLPSVPLFQILCISGALQPLQNYNLNILKVKGRSDLLLKLNLITKIIPMVLIFAIIPLGIYGIVWFQSLFAFVLFYINSYYSGRFVNFGIFEQIKDVWIIFGISILTGVFIYFLNNWIIVNMPIPILVRIIINFLFYGLLYLLIASFSINIFKFYKELLMKLKF